MSTSKSLTVTEMGGRPRAKWAEKWGTGCCAPVRGELPELGPHLTQCRSGRGLPPYRVAS